MKRNKSILHLCEVILGVLMLILILNLYLVKNPQQKIPGEKASGIKRSRHHIRCRCYDV